MVGTITKMSDLETWFLEKDSPRFILYHGKARRNNGNSPNRFVYNEDDTLSSTEAWEIVKNNLDMLQGGEYTLLVKEPGKNTGPRCFFTKQGVAANNSIAGYSAFGGVNEYIETKLEIADLKRRLEEREPEMSFMERVFTPELVQELVTSVSEFLPMLVNSKTPRKNTNQASNSSIPAGEGGSQDRAEIINSLVESVQGFSDDQLASIGRILNDKPTVEYLLTQLNQGE